MNLWYLHKGDLILKFDHNHGVIDNALCQHMAEWLVTALNSAIVTAAILYSKKTANKYSMGQ